MATMGSESPNSLSGTVSVFYSKQDIEEPYRKKKGIELIIAVGTPTDKVGRFIMANRSSRRPFLILHIGTMYSEFSMRGQVGERKIILDLEKLNFVPFSPTDKVSLILVNYTATLYQQKRPLVESYAQTEVKNVTVPQSKTRSAKRKK